jgi:hypothetical protein
MFTFYRLGKHEGQGLYCSKDGLTYGGLPLVAKAAQGRFETCVPDGFFKQALADRAGGLRAVANALNKSDYALAAIAAVHLRLPMLDADQAQRIAKWDFNAAQPRVPKGNPAGGQWTNGGSNENLISDIVQDDDEDQPPGIEFSGYEVSGDTPTDAVSYESGDGTQFYAPPDANFFQVYASGLSIRGVPTGFDAAAVTIAVGHGGLFDYQRLNGTFYSQYTNASNYGVGVFMNGAGYTEDETKLIGSIFAHIFSSNPGDSNRKIWWKRGWEDAEAGRWR